MDLFRDVSTRASLGLECAPLSPGALLEGLVGGVGSGGNRRPTPTALKILRGNPRQHALNKNEPEPRPDIGEPPEEFTGVALAEWHRLGPQLVDMGVLTEADIPAFVSYCKAWARYLEAEAQIAKTSVIVRSPNGYPIQNPYLAISTRAYKHCREFWVEYGMTAASRSRIQVSKRPDKSAANQRKSRFFGGVARGA